MLKRLSKKLAARAERHRGRDVAQRDIAPLMQSVRADATILEVGGGYNPRFTKSAGYTRVFHLDHGSTAELRAKYGADPTVAHLAGNIQHVDFIYQGQPLETLVPPDLRFDVIYSSHCLEHQVDLIGHLQSLEKLLKPGGRLIEIIPDLRRCFDLLRFPTVTGDVLMPHLRPAPVHQGKQVFDSVARELTCNVGRLPTDLELQNARFAQGLRSALDATRAAEPSGVSYADRHAWTFTPESFRLLMIELRLLGLTRLRPTFVSAPYGNQFCAVLQADPGPLTPAAEAQLEAERLELAMGLRLKS